MVRSRKTIFLSIGVAASTIFAALLLYGSFHHGTSAQAALAPELISALPMGAQSLVYIDLGAMRASPFYQQRPDKGPIAIPNQDYADFIRSTGFDFEKDLDRVVMASWPGPSAKETKKAVVIAEGRFDRAKIREYALRKGKLDHQQGHEVFLFPSTVAGMPAGMNSITFLDGHRLALVSGPSIAPLFEHSGDPSSDPAGDPARERAAHLDGAAAFMIVRVPPIPDNAGGASMQGPASAQLMSLARSVQWVTLAARPEGDNLRISLEGESDNATDAMQLKAALELLRMFGRAGLENPNTTKSMPPATLAMLQNLLTNAEVTQAAERVRIRIQIPPDVWRLNGRTKSQ